MVDTTNSNKIKPVIEWQGIDRFIDEDEQNEFKDTAEQWGNSLLEEMNVDHTITKNTNIFSFATAHEYIKEGKKVSRQGWNNKRIWIILYNKGNNYYRGINLNGFEDFIVMMTIEGKYIPWTPSHTDLLTDDWILI